MVAATTDKSFCQTLAIVACTCSEHRANHYFRCGGERGYRWQSAGPPVWLLVTAAIGGAIAAHAPPSSWLRDHIERSRRRRSEIKGRAELQNRWVLRGDNRGVYMERRALQLMCHISASAGSRIPRNRGSCRRLHSADELELLEDKLSNWCPRHSFPLWCSRQVRIRAVTGC